MQRELKAFHAMPAAPRYQWRLQTTEEIDIIIIIFYAASFRWTAPGRSAVIKRIPAVQLWTSSKGGPLVCPPPPRTQELLLQPWSLNKPAVTAKHYRLVGNFKQTSSKGKGGSLGEALRGSANVPLGTVYWTSTLCVTLQPWEQGHLCKCLFLCSFGPVLPIQKGTQTRSHDCLIHDARCRGGYVLPEIITVCSFHCPLFHWCLV